MDYGMKAIETDGLSDLFKELSDQLAAPEIIYTIRARIGAKPKFHKGRYGNRYDYYTCGNCGATTKDSVVDNYCHNCGYRILWDNPRCLTK